MFWLGTQPWNRGRDVTHRPSPFFFSSCNFLFIQRAYHTHAHTRIHMYMFIWMTSNYIFEKCAIWSVCCAPENFDYSTAACSDTVEHRPKNQNQRTSRAHVSVHNGRLTSASCLRGEEPGWTGPGGSSCVQLVWIPITIVVLHMWYRCVLHLKTR